MAATSSEMTITKNILMNDALLQYIFNTSVYPREDECMKELRHITMNHPMKIMGSPPDELQFLAVLIKLMNAKNTLEIGVFTGCSLLATALAIPHDGKVVAIDVNREFYELGLPVIKKAGVEHKIDFREGAALTILDELLSEEKNKEAFDFIFIDADKANYLNYHEKGLQLVKVGGLIAYDNTLWNGYVAGLPDGSLDESDKIITNIMIDVNKALAADPRVEICQLSIADGLTLCRRCV